MADGMVIPAGTAPVPCPNCHRPVYRVERIDHGGHTDLDVHISGGLAPSLAGSTKPYEGIGYAHRARCSYDTGRAASQGGGGE